MSAFACMLRAGNVGRLQMTIRGADVPGPPIEDPGESLHPG